MSERKVSSDLQDLMDYVHQDIVCFTRQDIALLLYRIYGEMSFIQTLLKVVELYTEALQITGKFNQSEISSLVTAPIIGLSKMGKLDSIAPNEHAFSVDEFYNSFILHMLRSLQEMDPEQFQ